MIENCNPFRICTNKLVTTKTIENNADDNDENPHFGKCESSFVHSCGVVRGSDNDSNTDNDDEKDKDNDNDTYNDNDTDNDNDNRHRRNHYLFSRTRQASSI